MKKLLLTTAAFLSLASTAHAATLIDLGSTVTYGAGSAVTGDINIAGLNPATQLILTGDAHVINPALPNSAGQYTAPDGGSVFGNNYLAVINTPGPSGTATYNLAPSQTTFGFTWGSVDAFNTLVVNTTNGSYTITGQNIKDNVAGVSLGSTDEDVTLQDTLGGFITSLVLTTSQNSFEVANFETATATPLPASVTLFGSALLGFAALAFFRRKAV